jgi:uncharacterized protein (TIGR03083 family)
MPLEHPDLCGHIDAEAALLLGLLDAGGPDALRRPVPSCPEWSVRDLVEHLGTVHRWAAAIVCSPDGRPAPEPERDYAEGGLGPWFAEGAGALTQVLRGADPAAPCWTLARPHTIGFWSRRQAHETAVHRVDLADALGAEAPLDPVLAVDGVDEAVRTFFPRQVRLGREQPLADALAVVESSSGRRWLLAGDGSGPDEMTADATVTGSAADLLLLLWRRRSLDDLSATVVGDEAAARRVLGANLTP